jgi:hypothetical protein
MTDNIIARKKNIIIKEKKRNARKYKSLRKKKK